jgi:D-alanyl-D-alanine carboxypeptidase/D-alanyl-D-alanine-endopeptidase (penicillin-binding protein 4)
VNRLLLQLVALIAFAGEVLADAGSLPDRVRSALNHRDLPHESLSVHVQDLDTGEVVLAWRAGEARNSGSSIKLLTTLVALDVLGPAHRWQTRVYALGDVESGELRGDLLLEGGGDPYLVAERVWLLQQRLRLAGIRRIDGDLLINDAYFDVGEHNPAAFDRQPLRAYNVAPNALMMNFKVIRYWFRPVPDTGKVTVELDPPLANVRIENRLRTGPGPCRGYQRGITMTANADFDEITLTGKFPQGCKRYAMDRTALSHNAYAFGIFKALWLQSGSELSGSWNTAPVPENAEPVLVFESPTLAEVITRVNKHSNNVMARHLLYTLAAEVLGAPGTEAGGRKVVGDWLVDNDLELSTLAFENGAGLSRDVRISASDFGALLKFAWQQPYMPEFVASMPISGMDGTLRRKFGAKPLLGRAHLKTGTLDHVAAISGYLQSRSGRRFSVVALQNHTDVHRGTGAEVQDALLRWLYEQ